MDMTDRLAPLRDFVNATTRIVGQAGLDEATCVAQVREHLARLIADDGWLPEAAARPHPEHYQQYLLHCDPLERFCVVSFVWGPGQRTPIHDHGVWGLVGMLRGEETGQAFESRIAGPMVAKGPAIRLSAGDIELVSPRTGDIHQVANALSDQSSISIHVYGGNIGAVVRHVFDPATGATQPFVSGYSATTVPNLWDRSGQVRATL